MASADNNNSSDTSSPGSISGDRTHSIGSEEPLADHNSSTMPVNSKPKSDVESGGVFNGAGNVNNKKSSKPASSSSTKGYYFSKQRIICFIFLAIALIVLVALITGLSVRRENNCSDPTSAEALNLSEDDISNQVLYEKDIRLPETFVPLHYTVNLEPMLDPDFIFTGSVDIEVRAAKAASQVILHSKTLTISDSDIAFMSLNAGASSPEVKSVEFNEKKDFLIINLSDSVEEGESYLISIKKFKGELTDRLNGLYRSEYKRKDGTTAWLMASQMQPTDARRAFPCFDEPALKATFQVNFIRPNELTSISNMDIVRTETYSDTKMRDIYNTSVPMSTYLLAFVMSDFQYREVRSSSGVQLRVWARPDAIEETEYALSISGAILTFFEEYFKIPFPLSKLDQIAVPDFAAGAMENWGLVIYRETALLYNENTGSIFNKKRVAVVISHELAHQWFGNLATPKWWDDLWLNEGFASYVEYLGVNHVHPEWKMLELFVENELHHTFQEDGIVTSHPISVQVSHPDEVNELFDSISYGKGAAIIRMMRHFLGEENFRHGVSTYLNEFRYGSTVQDDLWRHLTKAAEEAGLRGLDVKKIMDSWTLQMGLPIVQVDRDYDTGSVSISQKRFLRNPNATDPMVFKSPFDYKWYVPCTVASRSEIDYSQIRKNGYLLTNWLNMENGPVQLNNTLPATNEWILANILQTAYYRVNYDDENWRMLQNELKSSRTVIDSVNRAQIVDDALNLALAGELSYDVALNITDYLISEQDYLPWSTALSSLSYIDLMLQSTQHYGLFKSYMVRQISPIYTILGWQEESSDSYMKQALRTDVLNTACYYGVEDCVESASGKFKAWMANPSNNPIPPNHKSLVYCNAIRHGDDELWNFAWDQYQNSSDAAENVKLLYGMSCSKQPWILSRYLERTLDKDQIRRQDATRAMSYIAKNSIGKYIAWSFFQNNYNTIVKNHGGQFFGFSSLIKSVMKGFNTQFQLKELTKFIEQNNDNLKTGRRAFKQTVENTQSNIQWMERNLDIISSWLKNKTNR